MVVFPIETLPQKIRPLKDYFKFLNLKENKRGPFFSSSFLLKHVSVTLWEKECLEATSAFPRQQEEPPTDADHVVFLKLRQAD